MVQKFWWLGAIACFAYMLGLRGPLGTVCFILAWAFFAVAVISYVGSKMRRTPRL